ncbi:MAG: hypothetical protein P4L98_14305 [Ancalomicrobiaceae bacterium]|nr:hypothetical protein [Ancalomicrobiaceae bacterium]
MADSAILSCSHTVRSAPPQVCTFGWTVIATGSGARTYQGSFIIWPGQEGIQVFLQSGVANALSEPIVLCQGSKSRP